DRLGGNARRSFQRNVNGPQNPQLQWSCSSAAGLPGPPAAWELEDDFCLMREGEPGYLHVIYGDVNEDSYEYGRSYTSVQAVHGAGPDALCVLRPLQFSDGSYAAAFLDG